MKQNGLFFGILLVLLAGGAWFYMSGGNKSESMMEDSKMMADDAAMNDDAAMTGGPAMMADDSKMMANDSKMAADEAGSYQEFSPEVMIETAQTRRVLFFYANWCPSCIPVDKALGSGTVKLPSDVSIIRVNYNDPETDQAEKDLAAQYDITYQHTFVQIDAAGEVVTKWNGGSATDILTRLK